MAQPGSLLSNVLPEGSRFCNRCGSAIAPPGLFCSACGQGSGGMQMNYNMVFVQPTVNQMIEANSTDVPPPAYDERQQPSAPYEPVAAPSHKIVISPPSLQPYGVQPTMGQPSSYDMGQSLPMGMPLGGQMGGIPMGSPIHGGGSIPMGSPLPGGQMGVPMGGPVYGQSLMMGMPLGPYEQKGGPAYPSPGLADQSHPPVGDWKAMRSPWPTLVLPRLWMTRDVNISLVPLARRDQEIRCLNFVHEPGVSLPEGLAVTESGNLVGQPAAATFLKEFYFMAKLQMGLSAKEKVKRKTAREREHKKQIKQTKKQHEAALKKNPNIKPYQSPSMAQPGADETDEIKWVLVRAKIGVLTRLESFLVATFCRGVPCAFTIPLMDQGQYWILPCMILPTLPFSIFVDFPCKAVALFYLVLALPFYCILGFCSNTFPDSLYPALALSEGCCGGIDQEGNRQTQTVLLAKQRANGSF